MEMNNHSRNVFTSLLNANPHFKRDGRRNVFIRNGMKYAFSVSTQGFAECRQFYEDCDNLLTLDFKTGRLYDIPREELNIQKTPSRVMSNGVRAFNAIADMDEDFLSGIKL